MKRGTIRHLMGPGPTVAACGVPWTESVLSDPRCAADLDDVSCRACLVTVAFQEHARRAARANRRSMELLGKKDDELRALRAQVVALQEAGVVLAKKLERFDPYAVARPDLPPLSKAERAQVLEETTLRNVG